MKKNLYYETVLMRRNLIKDMFYGFFLGLASYPRLLFEVFFRKSMGERYFSLSSSITVAIALAYWPLLTKSLAEAGALTRYHQRNEDGSFWGDFLTWYLFIAVFLFMAIKRYLEIKQGPSVFDFERFSLSKGTSHPLFYKMEFFGKPNPRTISVIYEPLVIIIGGIMLYLLGQKVGSLWILSGIIYSLSHRAGYRQGEYYIMEQIDIFIMNRDLMEVFVDDPDGISEAGVEYYGRKPKAADHRRILAGSITEGGAEQPTHAY